MTKMENLNFTQIIFSIGIFIVVFIVMREINLWYFKIDKRIEIQEETNRLLKKLIEKDSDLENYDNKKAEIIGEETDVNNPEALKKIIKNLNDEALK